MSSPSSHVFLNLFNNRRASGNKSTRNLLPSTLAIVMETQSPTTYPSTQASFDTCLLNNSFSRDSMPKMKIFESILCFPSQDFGNLKKYIFKKNISTNNIVSVKVAKLL
jgi:hypothetical protein